MNVSLASCLARSSRIAGTRSALRLAFVVPARSLTSLQSSRPFPRRIGVFSNPASSRALSWGSFGSWGSKKPEIADSPKTADVLPDPVTHSVEDTQARTTVNTEPIIQTPATTSSPPPSPPESLVPDNAGIAEIITDNVSIGIMPPPLQYGDMAALDLVHWTPAGFFPWLLEVIQVSSGLPFWGVIMLTTIGARIVLLPFVIRGTRSTARMGPFQPQLDELRQKVNRARVERDNLLMQQAMQQQQTILKRAGVNPLDQLVMSVLQICVQFGFFIALRRMCEAPVEQMKVGGFGYLMDLTTVDPYYITPILNTVLINLQLTITQRDMLAVGSPAASHILNGLRIFTLIGLPFMAYLPVAINLHLCTSIGFIALQTLVLRLPVVRTRLGIPLLPARSKSQKPPSMKDTVNYLRDWYKVKQLEAIGKAAERERKMRMVQRR